MRKSVKICFECNIKKPLTEFSQNKNSLLGVNNECKVCREEYNQYQRQWQRSYYRTKQKPNPIYRLNHSISSNIRQSLKDSKGGRKWELLVGYTLEDLKKHLEKQFQDGMTWGNYGEWHVDHIIPKSVFNFTKPEHTDFKRCWALKNLQPLWSEDNLKKRAQFKAHFQPSLLI